VERHPADETAAAQYLEALAGSGQTAALAKAAESILQSTPDWPPALRAAANAQARLGASEAALEHYRALERLQPLAGADAFAVGRCYVQMHNDAEAASWFTRALRDTLDGRTDWAEPAAVFMRLERWKDAAALYDRKLAQDSSSTSAWVNYALCKQQSKEYGDARRALLQAIALRPENVATQYALATNYVLMDSTRAARHAYETVVRLAASNPGEHCQELSQAYRWLSVVDLVDKNWSGALAHLDPALRLSPKDVELRLYRAQALFALNRKPEAKREFQTVLQMQPGNAEAKKGLTMLAQYN
jgi:tetratricopeptide (TPR) repeat protein